MENSVSLLETPLPQFLTVFLPRVKHVNRNRVTWRCLVGVLFLLKEACLQSLGCSIVTCTAGFLALYALAPSCKLPLSWGKKVDWVNKELIGN